MIECEEYFDAVVRTRHPAPPGAPTPTLCAAVTTTRPLAHQVNVPDTPPAAPPAAGPPRSTAPPPSTSTGGGGGGGPSPSDQGTSLFEFVVPPRAQPFQWLLVQVPSGQRVNVQARRTHTPSPFTQFRAIHVCVFTTSIATDVVYHGFGKCECPD
jgi:hypothetical protein